MLSRLDSLSLKVVIDSILHGFTITKKDASTSIGKRLVRALLRTSRKSINATTKSAKQRKVGFPASTDLVRRSGKRSMDSNIVESDVMVKGIGPKLGSKIGASKKAAIPAP